MGIFAFSRFALSISTAATLLASCNASPVPQSLSASSGVLPASPDTVNTGWLYVADDPFSIGIVYIFSYPDPNRRPVRAITRLGYVYGPCTDSLGNVWVPARSRSGPGVFEFAAGRTKRIARLILPSRAGLGECTVDPVTGNLAVLGTHSVNIFAKAKGKSTNYALGKANVMACAYDGDGNLFIDGMEPISTSFESFALYEMPKGHKTFSSITLDKRVGFAGGLEWDGEYVAVATGGNGIKPVIYRFRVNGAKGTVVQVVHPNGLNYQAWFVVGDGDVIGTSGLYGPKLRLWPYPGGGEWQWEMRTFETQGMAIASYR